MASNYELACIIILIFIFIKLNNSREHLKLHDPLLIRIKTDLLKIHPKAKDLQYYASDKSFTQDKKDMYLCLKDENKEYYPYSMLIYVSIHELAHTMSESIGHKEEFWKNFKFLLENAVRIHIYNAVDYSKNPISYCGMKIDENPLYKD